MKAFVNSVAMFRSPDGKFLLVRVEKHVTLVDPEVSGLKCNNTLKLSYTPQGKLKSAHQKPIFLKESKKPQEPKEDPNPNQSPEPNGPNVSTTGPERPSGLKDTVEFRRLSVINAGPNQKDPVVSSVAWLPTSAGIQILSM